VVINDLDVMGVTILPVEADAPLVIDPDTVLAAPPTFELLQAIARRHAEIFERIRGVQSDKLSQHSLQQVGWKTPDSLAIKQAIGVAIGKALNHL